MKTLASAADKDELLRRLRTVRPESARRWGRMSAPEMVCHLADAFRMVLGHKPCAPVRVPLPRPVMKWIALYLPLPWPSGIRTVPEIDQTIGGTKPVAFAQDLGTVEALMERFLVQAGGLAGQTHPVFGAMSPADWLRWGYLHTDHHLRQFGA
jgi:hypothetical protein